MQVCMKMIFLIGSTVADVKDQNKDFITWHKYMYQEEAL